MERGWITHLATNGAGTIHDWEYAWLGRSTESVRANVATGTFGTWDETGRYIHLALLAGGLRGEGYGTALGRFIAEDGTTLPTPDQLEEAIRAAPAHPLTPARADLLRAMRTHHLPAGRIDVRPPLEAGVDPGPGVPAWCAADRSSGHRLRHHRQSSDVQRRGDRPCGDEDFRLHRRLGRDARRRRGPVDRLGDHGTAGVREEPQLREQPPAAGTAGRSSPDTRFTSSTCKTAAAGTGRSGEPPKTNPAYYLRFCKSYSRMGGEMHYLQCDNAAFLHNLYHLLIQAST